MRKAVQCLENYCKATGGHECPGVVYGNYMGILKGMGRGKQLE